MPKIGRTILTWKSARCYSFAHRAPGWHCLECRSMMSAMASWRIWTLTVWRMSARAVHGETPVVGYWTRADGSHAIVLKDTGVWCRFQRYLKCTGRGNKTCSLWKPPSLPSLALICLLRQSWNAQLTYYRSSSCPGREETKAQSALALLAPMEVGIMKIADTICLIVVSAQRKPQLMSCIFISSCTLSMFISVVDSAISVITAMTGGP